MLFPETDICPNSCFLNTQITKITAITTSLKTRANNQAINVPLKNCILILLSLRPFQVIGEVKEDNSLFIPEDQKKQVSVPRRTKISCDSFSVFIQVPILQTKQNKKKVLLGCAYHQITLETSRITGQTCKSIQIQGYRHIISSCQLEKSLLFFNHSFLRYSC